MVEKATGRLDKVSRRGDDLGIVKLVTKDVLGHRATALKRELWKPRRDSLNTVVEWLMLWTAGRFSFGTVAIWFRWQAA